MNFQSISQPDFRPPLWTPKLLDKPSAWWGHVPFAFWVTRASKPRILVELGTHHGISYAAFCEAVARSGLATHCYAIDSWKGDEHAGFYGNEVYESLKAFHDQYYASFSALIRSDFDIACRYFDDASIDLLHIDGFHTYDGVRHDFETWRTKLSARGVVLFHDTNVRRDEFGVWRFFKEVSESFPSFEFLHAYGLGIVAVGPEAPEPVKRLCELSETSEIAAVREAFSSFGSMWAGVNEALIGPDRLRERIQQLEHTGAEYEAAVARLSGERDMLSVGRDTLSAERDALASKVQTLSDALSAETRALSRERDMLSVERDALASKVQTLSDALSAETRALSVERDQLLERTKALSAERDKLLTTVEALRSENEVQRAALSNTCVRLVQLHKDYDEREHAAQTLIAYVSERYRNVVRKRKLRALRRRLWLAWRRPPVSSKTYRLVSKSALFEGHFYLSSNPDVKAARIDPVVHYLLYGSKEGRDPSPWFSEEGYRSRYPDVAASGLSSVEHYEKFGRFEDRLLTAPSRQKLASCQAIDSARVCEPVRDSAFFDRTFYLAANPDVREKLSAKAHERKPPLWAGFFDAEWYLRTYPDVAASGLAPLDHYILHGAAKGRDPNEYFDVSWYLERNTDVKEAGVDPLEHYIEQGWKEGRDPGPKFSVKNYLDRHRDVRDAGSEPLEHYIRCGRSEGRYNGESYGDWIAKYDALDDRTRILMVKRVARLALQPKFSIVMPVYNTDLQWLCEAIESVRAQLYPHWELCISDDASTLPGIKELLREYVDKDERIRVLFREINGHISANSNSALSLATGDFIVLVDADDIIPSDALYWVAEEINAHPDVDLIYSDEDKIDIEGRRYDAYFKPDWNPALMLSQNMFSHLGVYRHSLVKEVGGFRLGFDGSQDHDLVLRCADATNESKIRHIPHVLYHWRASPESTASSADAKPYVWNAGARAIEDHLARIGIKGQVTRTQTMFYQVSYDPPDEWPTVSIVMPSGCKLELLRPCLKELLAYTTYPDYEVLLTVNEIRFRNDEQAACLNEFAKDPRVRVLVYKDCEFNYSWVNNWAAKQANGSILCFMNDDVKIITTDWLEKLVVRLQLNRVGAVGVMLYYPNETIQHAGVILGIYGVAGHEFKGMSRGSAGYFSRARLEQDLSCVTAACVVVRRELFEELNGFDERLAIAFNDVDFCIRLRMKGWRIIWTPLVEHYHLESQTIGHHASGERVLAFQKEVRMMRDQWGVILDSDPFYNPNLSLQDDKMELAFPPRAAKNVVAA